MVRDTGRGSTESVQLPRGQEQQGRLPGGGYTCVDSKHELAEGRQMRGPGGRQARSGWEGRGDDGPGAHGRAGGRTGQERTGGPGGRRAGNKEGFWAGMTCAVLRLKGQMWGRGW